MRKLIVTEFLTLDGVMEDSIPWQQGYASPEGGQFKLDELSQSGALLLGRVTYQGFARYWPSADNAFSQRMNALPKYVASTTLSHLEWNNAQLLLGHTAEAVTRLKEDNGGDLLVYGSAQLVRTLMAHDLVDLYRLLVYPVVLGEGRKLFGEGQTARLKLTESRPFPHGVQLLCYEPDRTPPGR